MANFVQIRRSQRRCERRGQETDGQRNAVERGLPFTAATQSLIESRAMRDEKNCSELIIIVDTICAMTANAVIFIIVNKFPKNGKIFTILKILFRAAKRALPRGGNIGGYHNIIRLSKVKTWSCILLTSLASRRAT